MEILSFIIISMLYLLVGWPLDLALHELGHASIILLLTKQKVTFQFGARGTKWEIHLGRLIILLYLEPGAALGCRYHLENYAALTRHQVFWITLGGLLASFLLMILCGALLLATNIVIRGEAWL